MIYFGSRDYIISPLFFSSGTILYGVGFASYMGLDGEASKIGNKAAAFAWKLTLFIITIILCIRMMLVILFSIDIGGYQLLGCSILSLALAMLIANEYYLHKGNTK